MAEIGTTSIDQLPVNPQNTVNQANSLPTVNQPMPQMQNIPSESQGLSSDTQNMKVTNYGQQINDNHTKPAEALMQNIDYGSQLNNVLKVAAESGATVLPSRDIPQNLLSIQQDEKIKPNYIPETKTEDYIGDLINKEKIIEENRMKQNRSDNIDYIYQELQLPLLVAHYLFLIPITYL